MSAPNTPKHSSPQQRSCDSLGACQCRIPACNGCTWVASTASRLAGHAFAPGVDAGCVWLRRDAGPEEQVRRP